MNGWLIAAWIGIPVLWALQTLLMAFYFLPRFARAHRELGIRQGRYDAERGYPRTQVRP